MYLNLKILLLPIFLFSLPIFAIAVDSFDGKMSEEEFFLSNVPITIDAEKLEFKRDKNSYTAKGSVVLSQDSNKITADDVTLDNSNGIAFASGGVKVEDSAGNYIEADSINIRYKEKTAKIGRAHV